MLRRLLFITVMLLLVVAHSPSWAIEIRNMHTGQEGKRAYIQYDLSGKPGEKEADITVTIEIGGEQYNPDKLSLSGDLGKNVKAGIGKRIWWDLLKDMPAGYDGEVVWTLDASFTAEQLAQFKSIKEREKHMEQERLRPLISPPIVPAPQQQIAAVSKPALERPQPTTATLAGETVFVTSDRTVFDQRHGLMWAKLGDDTADKLTYDRARSYIARMNRENFGGYNNWRLPGDADVAKLYASTDVLAKRSGKAPIKVLLSYFPNLENWHYWQDGPSSRPLGKGQQYSRSFDIEDGSATGDLKDDNLSILPVRETTVPAQIQPQKSAIIDTNKIFSDQASGLIWTQQANLPAERLTHDRALGFVRKLNNDTYAGYNDWRLPTVNDFKHLYTYVSKKAGASGRSLDVIMTTFSGYQPWYYWTSTFDISYSRRPAYAFDLESGSIKAFYTDDINCLLAVRGTTRTPAQE